MNTNKKLIIVSIFLVPLFAMGIASAQENHRPNATDATEVIETENAAPEATSEELTLQERLQKRKEARQIVLDNAQRVRIETHCKVAQAKIGKIEQRLTAIGTSRHTAYHDLVERLNAVSSEVKMHGTDTTKLDTQIAELQKKITAFETALANYQAVISDLADMDCAADPEAFKASLDEARTLRAAVVTESQAIQTFLRNSIKPALQDIRTALKNSDH